MYEDFKKSTDNTSLDLLKKHSNIKNSIKDFEEAMLNCIACLEKSHFHSTLNTENFKDDPVEDISTNNKSETEEENNKNTLLDIDLPEDSSHISEVHCESLQSEIDLSRDCENLIDKNNLDNNLILEETPNIDKTFSSKETLNFQEDTITKESIDFNKNSCSDKSCLYKEPSDFYTSLTTEETNDFEKEPVSLKRTIEITPIHKESFSKQIITSSDEISSSEIVENKESKKSITPLKRADSCNTINGTTNNTTKDLACLNKENLKRNQIVDFINNNFRGVNLTIYTTGAQKISGEVVFNYDYLIILKADSATYYINPKEIAYFY